MDTSGDKGTRGGQQMVDDLLGLFIVAKKIIKLAMSPGLKLLNSAGISRCTGTPKSKTARNTRSTKTASRRR